MQLMPWTPEKLDEVAAAVRAGDRGEFVKHLNDVREIRNDVMHFDPDDVAPEDLAKLRRFTRLLAAVGSTGDISTSA